MPNYNKNSVFAVSSAGTIPNRVDDLIFFEDINKDQLTIWNEFERIMATGDYNAAHNFIKGYAEIHGYFGDLYNLMIDRIKAVQNFLVLNETNINNATGAFSSFKKPEIFVYQEELDTPKNIAKDQVWIGPKDYFQEETVTESLNKLKILSNSSFDMWGLTITPKQDGYITINGTCTRGSGNIRDIVLGRTDSVVSNADIWSWWNYYAEGVIDEYSNGRFKFRYYTADKTQKTITFQANRRANMHANFLNLGVGSTSSSDESLSVVELLFEPIYNEVYKNLTVAFMVCKTAQTTPNQKFVKYGA